MKSRFARPMPCSPDSVPPSDSVSANTAAIAACARAFCAASAGSYIRLTCRLPLPAWPKHTIGSAYSCESFCTPATSAGIRDTGTTTSSLILPGARFRSAGDSALRAAHSRSRAASSAAGSIARQPSPRAAVANASKACGSVCASPSASIINNAPTSSGMSQCPLFENM